MNAPRFDYHLDSDIALVKYFNGAYETQPFGYFDGFGEFKIFPGTLSWIGRDTFTQLVIDPFQPATPDNLETINYVTTGPQLTAEADVTHYDHGGCDLFVCGDEFEIPAIREHQQLSSGRGS